MRLFAAVAALATAAPSSTARRGPAASAPPHAPLASFSWATLPVFAETSNVTGPFDDDALEALSLFGLFVTEKAYDYPSPRPAEDELEDLAKELKRRAALAGRNLTAIFYYNSNLDLPDYHLHSLTNASAPDWWMQDDAGEPVWAHQDAGGGARPPFPYSQLRIFNHSAPELRTLWVSECLNMTERGFDGCFVDRWTRTPKVAGVSHARMQQWSQDRDLATSALLQLAEERGFWLVSGGSASTVTAAQAQPGWKMDVRALLDAAQRGQGFLASRSTKADADLESEIAAFLVGCSVNHFFGAGRWTTNHTSRAGVEWLPEFDRPLGPPLGNATLRGTVYTRSFASGTKATFDTNTQKGSVSWAASDVLA